MIAPHQIHLRALVSGIPEPLRSARRLFMLQALIDESDSQGEQPRIFIMGGYLASVEQWERLTEAWQSELDRYPRLEYFSFREAFPKSGRPRGQFHRFTFEQRDERAARFRRIIEENVELQFGIGFQIEHYLQAYEGVQPNHYHFAVPALLFSFIQRLGEFEIPRQPIDIIFDDRKIEESMVTNTYYTVRDNAKSNPGPALDVFAEVFVNAPMFRSSRKVIALQAADMLVGSVRAANLAWLNGRETPVLPAFRRSIPGLWFAATERFLLERAVEDLKQLKGTPPWT